MSTRNSWGAVRKLPSKRFQASYVAPDGCRYTGSDTFVSKNEANYWLATVRIAINEGRWVSPNDVPSVAVSMRLGDYAVRHIQIQTNRKGELLLSITGLWVIVTLSRPFDKWRTAIVAASYLLFAVVFCVPFVAQFFGFGWLTLSQLVAPLGISMLACAGVELTHRWANSKTL